MIRGMIFGTIECSELRDQNEIIPPEEALEGKSWQREQLKAG